MNINENSNLDGDKLYDELKENYLTEEQKKAIKETIISNVIEANSTTIAKLKNGVEIVESVGTIGDIEDGDNLTKEKLNQQPVVPDMGGMGGMGS